MELSKENKYTNRAYNNPTEHKMKKINEILLSHGMPKHAINDAVLKIESLLKERELHSFDANTHNRIIREQEERLEARFKSLLEERENDAIGFANWFKYQSKYQHGATKEAFKDYLKQK